jgi:16S rRNA (guanine966-N2)-methyltransferase
MLRIVAGKFRGRKLVGPSGDWLRPTSDRVRESIYNVLQGLLPGARVLDLYAGTGALGLEALSRGAAEVVLVESSQRARGLIGRNLERLGAPAGASVVGKDALAYLRTLEPGRFDLILADPPYAAGVEEALLQGLCRAGPALFVFQHRRSWKPAAIPEGYAPMRSQRFGDTVVDYFQRQEETG